MNRQVFDLSVPAPNGLRRGRTTGACATAAVKAALLLLLRGERVTQVSVRLPDPAWCLLVPVRSVDQVGDAARAEVVKDAGDDPDCTHGAVISALVKRNDAGQIRFLAGPGVGTATAPGLRVALGEPAINPVPRQMMGWAVEDVAGEEAGFDLEIGCEGGEALARKTYNPRLGIVGGISILGTSGIVEPMSLSAYQASIEVYIRVALGAAAENASEQEPAASGSLPLRGRVRVRELNSHGLFQFPNKGGAIALLPGKIGAAFGSKRLKLPTRALVQISNFLGFAVDQVQALIEQGEAGLDTLWLLGHPGKLAKVLDGHWDTHSSRSAMAMPAIAREAEAFGFDAETVAALAQANTVEAAAILLNGERRGREFWIYLENRIAATVARRVPAVPKVEARLFMLDGTALGAAA
ncbi:cobalt-precorrin-5B (C(1))-methyltransferase CbiD [Methylogaea oryzae]|uniref:Cobalt-precorrin-5B C(1)-methyltransferase n=1 Tax=Methylogaea oryzae TaxID=1295382 RepID=A0A8D5AL53_9GAMM|nr:cobalt-precorrin-5B (C(1))-methyltransferase CbiD [Methylogaea oryzae]BBL71761.1 cobalt-precorrin-5B C(1)-methyltransferase [Methylogaea oryzae]